MEEPASVKSEQDDHHSDVAFTDDPINAAKDDILGREAFADAIQRILRGLRAPGSSAVVGLQGPWGSGKSSVLNLLQPKLERSDWMTTRFNPWEVSDLDSLLRGFFTSLSEALPEELRQEGRKRLAQYASGIAKLLPEVNLGLVKISAEKAVDAITGGDTLAVRRERIESLLAELKQPLVVLLDDLDRLHPNELLTVFKLVRLVGRLPNVFYVLAFDEETIVDVLRTTAISGNSQERARSYLEKIVQVRIDLPSVHESQLSQLLNEGIGRIAENHSVDLASVDFSGFANQYQTYLRKRLSEPRSVKRYLAQVEAYYPLVENEVDFADYLLVTFLRVFHGNIYRDLPHRKEDLVRSSTSLFGVKPDLKKVQEDWIRWVGQRGVNEEEVEHVLGLLGSLFVPVRAAMEDVVFGGSVDDHIPGERRVGSSEYFDRYFQHAVPPDDIPDALVREAMAELMEGVSGKSTERLLAEVETKGDRLLMKLERHVSGLDAIAKERLLHLLAIVAPDLDESGEFIFLSPRDRAEILAGNVLNELVSAGGNWDVDNVVQNRSSLRFVSFVTRRSLRDARKNGKVPAALEKLVEAVARHNQAALEVAMQRPLEESEEDARLLFDLFDLIGRDEGRAWLQSQSAGSRWTVEDFVALSVGVWRSGKRRTVGDLSTETLQSFFDLDEVRHALGPMEDLTEPPGALPHDLPATWENRRWVGKWVLKRHFEKEASDTRASDPPGNLAQDSDSSDA